MLGGVSMTYCQLNASKSNFSQLCSAYAFSWISVTVNYVLHKLGHTFGTKKTLLRKALFLKKMLPQDLH